MNFAAACFGSKRMNPELRFFFSGDASLGTIDNKLFYLSSSFQAMVFYLTNSGT